MEVIAAKSALSTVGKLHDAVRCLQEAVEASNRNDTLMKDIASTVCIRAPIIKRLLLEVVHSDDPGIDSAFSQAVEQVVQQMGKARLVVYAWLVKNPLARLAAAGDMERELREVRHVLDRCLEHVQALQVDDIRHRVIDMQQGTQQVQQAVGVYHARVDAVAGQLERLLEGGWRDPRETLAIARFALNMTRKGYVKLKGHTNLVWCVAWSPNGSRVATASLDGTAAL